MELVVVVILTKIVREISLEGDIKDSLWEGVKGSKDPMRVLFFSWHAP